MDAEEIAKIAGVSRSTVTRVVNNYSDVAQKTREKVLKVIEEHKYAPNSSARILAGKKQKEIGLFMGIEKKIASSLYYGELISYVIDSAESMGYSVVTSIIKNYDFGKMAEFLYTNSIQGAIVVGGPQDENMALKLFSHKHRIIFTEQFGDESKVGEYFGIVNYDNFEGGYRATEYLIKNGHKRIMHMAGMMDMFSAVQRMEGYKKALQDNGIAIDNSLILETDYGDTMSEEAIKKYLENNRPPTAVFASTDMSAIGTIKGLREMGYSVPKDVSIVGFDNLYISSIMEPKLTTISPNIQAMAYDIVEMLIDSIENNKPLHLNKKMSSILVERESVLKI